MVQARGRTLCGMFTLVVASLEAAWFEKRSRNNTGGLPMGETVSHVGSRARGDVSINPLS